MRKQLYVYFIFIGFIINITVSCKQPSVLEQALYMAGTNQIEMGKALLFYSENDSIQYLKRKAMEFLIVNMPGKYYLAGKSIDEFHTFIDSVYQIKQDVYYDVPAICEQFGKYSKYQREKPYIYWDIEHLTCDFLSNHVDKAFEVWRKSWAKHLDFNEFCEFLLPYRISNEEPELWIPLYHEQFHSLISDTTLTVKECATIINDALRKESPQIAIQSVNKSAIRPSSLINMKFGLCSDYAIRTVYVMRSLGIPVSIAYIPHWGKDNMGHTFNIVLDENDNLIDFLGGFDLLGTSLKESKYHAKIYRNTFGKQATSLALIHEKEPIPNFFKNPCLIDITGNFPQIGIHDVKISLPDKASNKFAYLCVFDPMGWYPVDWAKISDNEVVFHNVGKDVVYQLSLFNSSGVCPVGNPFLLDSTGNMHYFSPATETIDLVLERKQEISFSLLKYPNLIAGSKFQGANTPDFSDAEDLHTLDEAPDFKYTTISVSSDKPYQYVRYVFPDTAQGNMAEVEFYEKESMKKLQGTVIGDYSISQYYPLNGPEKMFDGDALTFFHTYEDKPGWGGLQFDKPVYIDKIRYLIRNDDNGIRKGEVFELLYMNDGNWISMGKKTATEDDMIVFKDVPKGALYWLRNHSKGKEERPFTCENGKQIFR
jgi:hypothetical protein